MSVNSEGAEGDVKSVSTDIFLKERLLMKTTSRLSRINSKNKKFYKNKFNNLFKYCGLKGAWKSKLIFENWYHTLENKEIGTREFKKYSICICDAKGIPIMYFMTNENQEDVIIDASKAKWDIYKNGFIIHKLNAQKNNIIMDTNSICQLILRLEEMDWPKEYNIRILLPENIQTIEYNVVCKGEFYLTNLNEKIILLDKNTKKFRVEYDIKDCTARNSILYIPKWPHQDLTFPEQVGIPKYTPINHPERIIENGETFGPYRAIPYTISKPYDSEDIKAIALFVGGSGSYDRHGIIGKIDLGYHRILDGLALKGIASLRFEKHSMPNQYKTISVDDIDLRVLVEEAKHCLSVLERQFAPSNKPILLIGHSFGLLISLVVANETNFVGGIISLSGMGRTLAKTLDNQNDWVSETEVMSEASHSHINEERNKFFDILRETDNWDDPRFDEKMKVMKNQFKLLKSVIDVDPISLLPNLRAWILFVQGENDVQVTVADAQRLYDNAQLNLLDSHLWILPDYNHLFRVTENTDLSALHEYADANVKIPTVFIEDLSNMIDRRLNSGRFDSPSLN